MGGDEGEDEEYVAAFRRCVVNKVWRREGVSAERFFVGFFQLFWNGGVWT